MQDDYETIRAALWHIPPYDRQEWVDMAMAVKAALGESGFTLWDQWSQQDTRPAPHGYQPAQARGVWKSVKSYGNASGRIGPGTLFHVAQKYGWTGKIPDVLPQAPPPPDSEPQRDMAAQYAKAAQRAETILKRAEWDVHPYLEKKGFPDTPCLVVRELAMVPISDRRNNQTVWRMLFKDEIIYKRTAVYELPAPRLSIRDLPDMLAVPMRHYFTGKLQSIQMIEPDGTKRFLRGGQASQAVHRINRGPVTWWCEGLATALSIEAALQSLYRTDGIVICFSAANIAKVADGGFVVADHDGHGVGEKYARQTGLPFWMPPSAGQDANDYHLLVGLPTLAERLRQVLLSSAGGN